MEKPHLTVISGPRQGLQVSMGDFTAKTHRRDAESAEFYISIISAYSASRR
jgi:hypothetical protein